MQYRLYGRGDDRVSIVGMGGIVVAGMEQPEADAIVRWAFEAGVDYYDVAPSYGDAEDRLGPAIASIRDRIFLACKTEKRTGDEADDALATSLKKLGTDRLDLYQLHGLQSLADAERCFAKGGAMETLLRAKETGVARHLGFSAHSTEAALFCLREYPFDSVLFPLNYQCFVRGLFGPEVVKAAQAAGATLLALKAMARRPWPEGAPRTHPKCWYEPLADEEMAELALRWTLSLPIAAAIPPGDPDVFRLAVAVADRYAPLDAAGERALAESFGEETPIFGSTTNQ